MRGACEGTREDFQEVVVVSELSVEEHVGIRQKKGLGLPEAFLEKRALTSQRGKYKWGLYRQFVFHAEMKCKAQSGEELDD